MNDREKKMLTGLGIVAFLGLNMILYSSYKVQKKTLEDQVIKLREEVKTRDQILQEGADWTQTLNWFAEHPVTASTVEDAQNKLFNEVKAAAERCKLIIDPSRPVSFLPAVTEGAYPRVRVSLGFSCTDTALFQWITQMNEPQKFRAVTQLVVEPNKDRTLVKVSAFVEQWLSPDIPAPESSTEEEKSDKVEKSPAPSPEK